MYDLGENKTAYNNAVNAVSRAISGKVDVWQVGDESNITYITDSDDLQSIEIERGIQADDALIGNAVSKKYTIKIIDRTKQYTFSGKRVIPYIGIDIGQAAPFYIPFPEADVYEAEYDASSKVWTLTCYDDMQKLNNIYIQSLTTFDAEDITAEGEISLKNYAEAVCALAGLTLSTNTFFLEDITFTPNVWVEGSVEEEGKTYPNLSGNETLREVLSRIAEAAVSNAVINKDGNIELVSIVKTFDALNDITITGDEYFSCKIDEKFGPINTIVLSNEEQNDNVYYPAVTERENVYMDELQENSVQEHINEYGLNEFKISDNPFLDRASTSYDSRYDYLEDIFNEVKNLSYYAYALEWRGNPALDEGDRIIILDLDDTEIETTYFKDTITFNGALRVSSEGEIVSQTATEYEQAATYRNLLRKTELKVDKYTGTIESVVSATTTMHDTLTNAVESIETLSSSLTQTEENITAQIKKSGGSNLIQNSSGRGGTTSWTVSESGIVNTGVDAANTISNSYFEISSGSISQTFTLAAGEYSLSFRYKNNSAIAYVNINNEDENVLDVSAEEPTDWTKIETIVRNFEIETIFTITIGADRESFMIADIMLSEGNSEAWSQAPDEMYATGISFDSNGLHINQSNAETEFVADSAGVRIIRAEESSSGLEDKIASFDIYGTTTKQLSSEGQIAAGKVRIIPIDEENEIALMTVIND